jgi:hypothetical protein
MKTSLQTVFTIAAMVLSSQVLQAQVPDQKLKQDLFNLEQALNVGVFTHDTTALKQILAKEYELSGPRFPGAVRRGQWLASVPNYSVDSVTITNVTVTNWGEIAVFRSLQHFYNLIIGGQPGPYTESFITDLWIMRSGSWQLVTRLSERLPKK